MTLKTFIAGCWYSICIGVICYVLWMEVFNAIPMEAFGG